MTGDGNDTTGERLNLRSRMSELTHLYPWIERLTSRHRIPANTQFAMNLCLEEAISNIIRHGYSGDPDHSIVIRFTSPRRSQNNERGIRLSRDLLFRPILSYTYKSQFREKGNI
jgi:two-component sensor histidine kinase